MLTISFELLAGHFCAYFPSGMSSRSVGRILRIVLSGSSATELAGDDASRKEHTWDPFSHETAGGFGPFPSRCETGHRSTANVPEGQAYKHSVRK